MKIIKANYEILNEPNQTRKIERIARICYKSEDKIGEGTDAKMLHALISRQHTAMLEHGDIAFYVNRDAYMCIHNLICHMTQKYHKCQYPDRKQSFLRLSISKQNIISGNIRAWYDFFQYAKETRNKLPKKIVRTVCDATNNIFGNNFKSIEDKDECYDDITLITDFSKLTDAERMMHETFSVIFTCDRGVTHELVRMRMASFAQESTRYCNYSQNKFNNEISVIEPCFKWTDAQYQIWKNGCEYAEKTYFALLESGATPQEARTVLPTSVKADIAVTATLNEWRHIFKLRACDATGSAHPQMKELCCPLCEEMQTIYPFAFADLVIKAN